MATSITPLQNEELFSFPAPEDRLNQTEVAALFGRSVQTIINWKKKGKIPYFEMGRFPVFSKMEKPVKLTTLFQFKLTTSFGAN